MSIRIARINSEIQKSVTLTISSKIKDDRVGPFASVSEVNCAKDLKTAKVYIVGLGDDKTAGIKALNEAAGFIRRELAKDISHVHSVPQLTFFIDNSMENAEKIDKILDNLTNNATEQ